MKRPDDPAGLLLAMMEPSPAFEEEFQDWYDLEHFPERAEIDGFLTATRLICVDGWPRYLTLYDLADVDVLRADGYGRIAGNNYSRWTNRVILRLWGQYRAEAVQIYPGQALLGAEAVPRGSCSGGFATCRPRRPTRSCRGSGHSARAGLRRRKSGSSPHPRRTPRTISGSWSFMPPIRPRPGAVEVLGESIRHLDMVNSYTHHNRS
jgi:hypothetical protein